MKQVIQILHKFYCHDQICCNFASMTFVYLKDETLLQSLRFAETNNKTKTTKLLLPSLSGDIKTTIQKSRAKQLFMS